MLGANPPVHLYSAGPGFATVLYRNGTERDQKIAQHMIDRKWGATMVLTEPDAGSDVGRGAPGQHCSMTAAGTSRV